MRDDSNGKNHIETWGATWGVASLATFARVEFSSRLRRSLGRAEPARGVLRLSAQLKSAPDALFEEVLCHELAHVAVHLMHKRPVRPHGPEWATLMRQAGFEPRVRFHERDLPSEFAPGYSARRRATRAYLHTCPVCHVRRVAGRPVRAWRCVACVDSGLDGRLLITSLAVPQRRSTR